MTLGQLTKEQRDHIRDAFLKVKDQMFTNVNIYESTRLALSFIDSLDELIKFVDSPEGNDLPLEDLQSKIEDLEFIRQAVVIQSQYITVLKDVIEGKNLELHLEQMEDVIAEMDKKISALKSMGKTNANFESIRNEYWYLKWQILEQL